MLTLKLMSACLPRDAWPMADHIIAPTASRELAEDLSAYDAENHMAWQRSVVTLRPELDPRLADQFEIGPGWNEKEGLAGLLAGRTARCNHISGVEQRTPWPSLAAALELTPGRLPSAEEIEAIAGGRLANGNAAPAHILDASRRFLALYGLKRDRRPDAEALQHMADGRRANGNTMGAKVLLAAMSKPRNSPTAVLHLTFNASKTLSSAFALLPHAQRAILLNAHREAVSMAMVHAERFVAHVRRGDGGDIVLPAKLLWVRTTHYTSRSTRSDELHIAGDPHVHDHVLLMCTAIADDGKLGKIDLAGLHGFVKQLSSYYHFCTAALLRGAGISVTLHPEEDCLRIDAVPRDVEVLFSKRTNEGDDKAELFAAERGIDLAELTHGHRAAILKNRIQGDPRAARRDDVANLSSWREQAASIGASIPAIVIRSLGTTDEKAIRIELATEAAKERLAMATAERRSMKATTAATLGGIAAGIDDHRLISRVALDLDDVEEPRKAIGIADRRKREHLDEESVSRRSIEGSALLIGGGHNEVVAEAARRWVAMRSTSAVAYPIMVACDADIADVEMEARRHCREIGLLGPTTRAVRLATSDGGATVVDLACGEPIIFTASVNGRMGTAAGRVGSAGSLATLLDMDDKGVRVMTLNGEATISSSTHLRQLATVGLPRRRQYALADPYLLYGPGSLLRDVSASRLMARAHLIMPGRKRSLTRPIA